MWYTIKEAARQLGCDPKVLINLKYRNGLNCETCVPDDEIVRLSKILVNGRMPTGNRFRNAKFSKRKRQSQIDKVVEKVLQRLSCEKPFGSTVDDVAHKYGCAPGTSSPTIAQVEKAMILDAMRTIRNTTKVAHQLGIGRRTLYRKLEQYKQENNPT